MSNHEAPKPASADVESGEPAITDDDASMTDEPDDGDKWTTQMTKKRRHGSNSSQSTIISQPLSNLTVIVKPTDPTKLVTNLNPLVLKKKLEDVAPDGIIQIRPNYRLNLLALDTRNVESTKALLRLKSLGAVQVMTYEPPPPSAYVGVIRGVSTEIADAELCASLREKAPVIQVRRLGTSEAVKLTFSSGVTCEHVYIGHTRYEVFPYLEKPRQCPKCNRFGHIASTCSKAQRCSRCGGEHDISTCGAEQPKCTNCSKRHDATSPRCPIYKVEKQIANYKSSNNMDYTSAKSAIISNQETRGAGRYWTPRRRPQRTNEDKGITIPLNSENEFPSLKKQPATTTPKTPVTTVEPSASSSAEEATMTGPLKDKQNPTRKSSVQPTYKNSRSDAAPKPQSLGNALCTLTTMLRTFLASLHSQFAQSLITIIDIVVPLITSWCH